MLAGVRQIRTDVCMMLGEMEGAVWPLDKALGWDLGEACSICGCDSVLLDDFKQVSSCVIYLICIEQILILISFLKQFETYCYEVLAS